MVHPHPQHWHDHDDYKQRQGRIERKASNGKDLDKRQRWPAGVAVAEFDQCSSCGAQIPSEASRHCESCYEALALETEARINQAEHRVSAFEAEKEGLVAQLEERVGALASRESEARRLRDRIETLVKETAQYLQTNQELRCKVDLLESQLRCQYLERQLIVFQNQEVTISDLGAALAALQQQFEGVQRDLKRRLV